MALLVTGGTICLTLQQRFSVTRPNTACVTDITYLRTWQGWLALSRRRHGSLLAQDRQPFTNAALDAIALGAGFDQKHLSKPREKIPSTSRRAA
jgi:hypothetical protein